MAAKRIALLVTVVIVLIITAGIYMQTGNLLASLGAGALLATYLWLIWVLFVRSQS